MPKIKKITERSSDADKEKLVMDLIRYLIKHDYFQDICIYYNDKQILSNPCNTDSIHYFTDPTLYEKPIAVRKDVNVEDYVKYCNKNLMTMTFEGPLYDAINHDAYDHTYEDLQKFFNKRGLFFELGYAWSLAVYEN